MMMTALGEKDSAGNLVRYCVGLNNDGEAVDVTEKYAIMAKLCFSTSLILTITNIAGGVFGACNKEGTPNGMQKLCGMLNCCGAIAFIANCFVIPITIFSAASADCHINDDTPMAYATLDSEFKGFKTIWIVMLAVSGGTLVLFFLVCCLMICCLGAAAMKLAKE